MGCQLLVFQSINGIQRIGECSQVLVALEKVLLLILILIIILPETKWQQLELPRNLLT